MSLLHLLSNLKKKKKRALFLFCVWQLLLCMCARMCERAFLRVQNIIPRPPPPVPLSFNLPGSLNRIRFRVGIFKPPPLFPLLLLWCPPILVFSYFLPARSLEKNFALPSLSGSLLTLATVLITKQKKRDRRNRLYALFAVASTTRIYHVLKYAPKAHGVNSYVQMRKEKSATYRHLELVQHGLHLGPPPTPEYSGSRLGLACLGLADPGLSRLVWLSSTSRLYLRSLASLAAGTGLLLRP